MNTTLVNPVSTTGTNAPSEALITMRAKSAMATAWSIRAAKPSSPRAFHVSQSFRASTRRPHW